ncbi:SDR family NAD(P)-dependent oxidoreductase [Chelativorans alearense]|uniref:SDR family NAD(P)-dependent oxidoreductase n=1 Tax=Chelativorans alearense TaxID=2681495 RepID=UPI0013D156AF|nr:SDR family NAD(P)-dependent oxidoreductase [Chelativorans alearense]
MKNWFITGISRGLGLALAKAVLADGDNVIGTVRETAPLLSSGGGRLRVLKADMSDKEGSESVVREAFQMLGKIDVIVNNAGYGLLGAVETSTEEELRHLFEVDVFAPIRITRTALPYLRAQGSGHIVNITSIAGRAPGVGIALYAAAKFAIEGFSASLSQEVAPLGIRVTAIVPGQFRTDFLDDTSVRKSSSEDTAYDNTVGATMAKLAQVNHKQLGNPDRAARVIVEAVKSDNPPLHLLLGSDALQRARSKLEAVVQEMEDWEAQTVSTDFAASS